MSLFRHVLVPLDASPADWRALDAATSTALDTGAAITLLLPRTPRVLDRLRPFAESERLTLPDAATAYVERAAMLLRDWAVMVLPESIPSTDPAVDLARYAGDHDVTLIVVVGHGEAYRLARRVGIGERLVRFSPVPVLVVPPETQESTEPVTRAA